MEGGVGKGREKGGRERKAWEGRSRKREKEKGRERQQGGGREEKESKRKRERKAWEGRRPTWDWIGVGWLNSDLRMRVSSSSSKPK